MSFPTAKTKPSVYGISGPCVLGTKFLEVQGAATLQMRLFNSDSGGGITGAIGTASQITRLIHWTVR